LDHPVSEAALHLESTIKPELCYPRIALKNLAEVQRIQVQQTKTMKWVWISGFEDGQTYETGVDEEIGMNQWMMGGLEEVWGRERGLGNSGKEGSN
jgi:hypothetical protein